jgi:hypothetical protein
MSVVFLIGVSAMGKADAESGLAALSDALAGIVIMTMVLLCPYATYKFVHWAADGGGHDDLHRAGAAGFAVTAGAAKTAGTLAAHMHTRAPAPQGPSRIPGMGNDGVASGIDPTGRVRKGGVDAGTPKPRTTFHFGANVSARGDEGRTPSQPPGEPALITRPSDAESKSGASATNGPATGGGARATTPADDAAPTGPVADPGPAPGTPPSTGPSHWTDPNPPPSGN